MKALPMIFNTEMVQALMDGRKVQTRRPFSMPQGWDLKDSNLCKITGKHPKSNKWGVVICRNLYDDRCEHDLIVAPCIPGDLIYVRETFGIVSEEFGEYSPVYKADNWLRPKKWKPSIHMPRELSRITLKVTGVRVDRVQDISEADAIAEGFKLPPVEGQGFAIGARTNFRHAWQQIYGDHWDRNGWVWVIDFDVILKNVDLVIEDLEVA